MKKVTKYIAFDETEFDTESECENYETSIFHSFDGVILFDRDKHIIEFDWSDISDSYSWCEAWYIYIVNADTCENAFEILNSATSFMRPDCPYTSGDVIAWSTESDSWFNLTQRIKMDYITLSEILDSVNSKIESEGNSNDSNSSMQ